MKKWLFEGNTFTRVYLMLANVLWISIAIVFIIALLIEVL